MRGKGAALGTADDGERTTDRWRRLQALYHEMLARPAHERAGALASACADDPALAAEAQALLDQPDSAAGFLGAPAMEVAARAVSTAGPPLTGRCIGAFEVKGLLGIGGMGEVYRAQDTKLGRDVAIKVLPTAVATDAERMSRFRREARVLAALNHPNIAAIYGLEEAAGQMFLVMELVEGEDLAERLRRGAMPVGEAIGVARQIAEGLEEAHEKGIVHRDLKPANIKVTPEGRVKVLDFGLAKAYASEAAKGAHAEPSGSPTRTRSTQAGMVLGTAGYMAPEQVRGAPVDKRADIWSFGVVLYEMLTGVWLFRGTTPGDTMAAVLKTEPDWSGLPEETPHSIQRLIRRCLERDQRQRLQAIGEARIALADVSRTSPADLGTLANAARGGSADRRTDVRVLTRPAVPWIVAGGLAAALAALLLVRPPWRSPLPQPRKLLSNIGVDASMPSNRGASAVLSPDGRVLAFVAEQEGEERLFVRRLDQLQATAITGAERSPHSPFFSPDGQSIAFFTSTKLKRVPVTGGATVDICDVSNARGGAWADDDTIIFSPTNASGTLVRVPSGGGTPVPFGTLSEGAAAQRWPQILPAGKGVLFTESRSFVGDGSNLVVATSSGGAPKVILRGGYYGRYVPSGHLLYLKERTLLVAPFDIERLEVTGAPLSILEPLMTNPVAGGAQIAFSSEGTLVYAPRSDEAARRPIEWMSGEGRLSMLRAEKALWSEPRFSPDGRKLAFDIFDGKSRNVFAYEWASDRLTQLTFGQSQNRSAAWSPDGRRIAFLSDRDHNGIMNLRRGRDLTSDQKQGRAVAFLVAPEWRAHRVRGAACRHRGGLDGPAFEPRRSPGFHGWCAAGSSWHVRERS